MLQGKSFSESLDQSWIWLFKIGGIAFLIIGIWYIIANYWSFIAGIPAPGFATPPVSTNEQYFHILASYPIASTIFYSMYSLIDLLFIPALLALYLALKGINKNAMLVAMGFVAMFAAIDIAVTEFNSLTLISLAQSYNAATDPIQRTAYFAAANYALGAIPIATFYSYVIRIPRVPYSLDRHAQGRLQKDHCLYRNSVNNVRNRRWFRPLCAGAGRNHLPDIKPLRALEHTYWCRTFQPRSEVAFFSRHNP